jgi:hypothetical protein
MSFEDHKMNDVQNNLLNVNNDDEMEHKAEEEGNKD